MATTMDNYETLAYLPSPVGFGQSPLPSMDYMGPGSNFGDLDGYSNVESEAYIRWVLIMFRHRKIAD